MTYECLCVPQMEFIHSIADYGMYPGCIVAARRTTSARHGGFEPSLLVTERVVGIEPAS